MQFADPSLSHPSRCSRALWPTKCQKQGWASRPEFRVLSLGVPADTRLLGKTVQTEILQQRGGVVKALTPRARPFCNLQVAQLLAFSPGKEQAAQGQSTISAPELPGARWVLGLPASRSSLSLQLVLLSSHPFPGAELNSLS